jgi:hypothetical protein
MTTKYTKWPSKYPITVKYTHMYQNIPKLGFLVCNYIYHLATLCSTVNNALKIPPKPTVRKQLQNFSESLFLVKTNF